MHEESELDDLLTSPRALFARLHGLDVHASRLLLDAVAARDAGHPALLALAFGPHHVLSGRVTRLLARQLQRLELRRLAARTPELFALLATSDEHPTSLRRRAEAVAAVESALAAPRSRAEGLALLPWLVAFARSESAVADAARAAAEEVLGAPLGDDAALVERLLGP